MDEKEYERAVAESGAAGHEMPGNPEQEDIPAVATVPGEPAEEAAKDADGADGAEKPCVIDYSREEGAVDKDMVEKSKIIIVSDDGQVLPIGRMLASHGVGDIIAFDPSFTQGGILDLSTATVLALGEHIKAINPDVRYSPYGNIRYITQDQEMDILPSANLFIFLTKSIYMAGYGAKISMQYHIPTIWAYSYSPHNWEMIFSIPGEIAICCSYQNSQIEPEKSEEYKASSTKNSLVSLTVELALAIIQDKMSANDYLNWFDGKLNQKYLRTQVIKLKPQ